MISAGKFHDWAADFLSSVNENFGIPLSATIFIPTNFDAADISSSSASTTSYRLSVAYISFLNVSPSPIFVSWNLPLVFLLYSPETPSSLRITLSLSILILMVFLFLNLIFSSLLPLYLVLFRLLTSLVTVMLLYRKKMILFIPAVVIDLDSRTIKQPLLLLCPSQKAPSCFHWLWLCSVYEWPLLHKIFLCIVGAEYQGT